MKSRCVIFIVLLPGQVNVVAQSRAALQGQRHGEHPKDGVHGPSFPQRLVQRLHVDTAGDKVGQQQQKVECLETCESNKTIFEHSGRGQRRVAAPPPPYLTVAMNQRLFLD